MALTFRNGTVKILMGLWVPVLLFMALLPPALALETGPDPEKTRIASVSSPQTREEIFQQVFGRSLPRLPAQKVWLYLVVNGRSRGKIRAEVSQDFSSMTLPSEPVLATLEDNLDPSIFQTLEREARDSGTLSGACLRQAGLEVDLDPSAFRLFLKVPPNLTGTRVHSLGGLREDPFSAGAREPSPFSAYLNWSAQQELDDPPVPGMDGTLRGPFGFGLDGAANYKGFVLEGSAFYTEGASADFRRKDLRLVRDLPRRTLRFSAGDIRFPVSGYQSVMNLGGAGLSRDYLLNPHDISYPTGEYSFYLENPSTVEVWINGALMQTLNLDAGDHDIRNFPSVGGENQVELRVRDEAGQRQVFFFSFIHEPSLLARGKDRFSLDAGVLRTMDGGDYHYDGQDPGVNLSYERGLTDRFTAGGFLQATTRQATAGLNAVAAFAPGKLQVRAAASTLDDYGQDWAGRVSFTSFDQTVGGLPPFRWRAEVEYLGEFFTRVSDPVPSNPKKVNTLVSLSMDLTRGIRYQVGGGWSFLRNEPSSESFTISNTLSYRYKSALSAYATARYSADRNGGTRAEAIVGLSFYWPSKNQSLTTTKAWDGDLETRWDWGNPTSRPGHARGYVSARSGNGRTQYKAEARATGNLGEARLYHRFEQDRRDGHQNAHQTELGVQSALVYADGNFAISRPVTNSFVIVKAVKNCRDRDIQIDPGPGGPRAESTFLGPAVLTDLTPYRLARIKGMPQDPPATYLPQQPFETLLPTYKSGFALYVGTETEVYILGALEDEGGKPAAYLPIEILFPSGSGMEKETTFTDAKGRFRVLAPGKGRCRIRPLSNHVPYQEISVDIPEGAEEIYRPGNLVLKRKTRESG